MPFDGYGTFIRLRSWIVDATNSVKIRADFHDDEDNNFAAGLSQCITKDGQTAVTQNIPMNSRRIISLADPVDLQDAATKDYADTKVSKAGGETIAGNLTIAGDLNVANVNATGIVSAVGYKTRAGLSGPYGVNFFNFEWTGAVLNAWVDTYNFGALANRQYVADGDATTAANAAAANAATAANASAANAATATAAANANTNANNRVLRSGDTMTGPLRASYGGEIGGTVASQSFMLISSTGNASMSFQTGGFGANFGLDSNGNFYMGGQSHGNGARYQFWTTRDFVTHPLTVEMLDRTRAELEARIAALEARLGGA